MEIPSQELYWKLQKAGVLGLPGKLGENFYYFYYVYFYQ